MNRRHLLIVLQSILAVAAVASVALSVPSTPSVLDELAQNGALALGFAATSVVLSLFSVWLPRGDSMDTTAAIAFAAGAVLQPIVSVATVAVARVVSSIARPRRDGVWPLLENLSRRAILLSVVYAVVRPDLVGHLSRASADTTAYVRLSLAALCFFAIDVVLEQIHTSIRVHAPLLRGLASSMRMQGRTVAAQLSVAVLTVLVLPDLSYWGLVISAGLLLVMRQSFALLLEVRASYTSTVEVLARSIEAYDPSRRGHAERVSQMVGHAGRMLGVQSRRLENLVYAALFHDVGRLGADSVDDATSYRSSEVLKSVSFLSGAVPVLAILDQVVEPEASLDEQDLVGAYLIARFSALDSELNMDGQEGIALANSIGARLYVNTRRAVDRAIRQVERDLRENGRVLSDAGNSAT